MRMEDEDWRGLLNWERSSKDERKLVKTEGINHRKREIVRMEVN